MIPLKIIDLSLVGSKELPLRPSQLYRLLECPLEALISISDDAKATSMAADTGSMVHGFAKAFHESKEPSLVQKQKDAVKGIAELKIQFPFANEEKALGIAVSYFSDPRNFTAKVIKCELPISFSLPADKNDPTHEPIYIEGTLDQIRESNGTLYLWDLKTGRQTGWSIIHQAAIQLAAYFIGARLIYPSLKIGGIIRTEGYSSNEISPSTVFCPMPYVERDVQKLMIGVQIAVANLRRKQLYIAPGLHCNYCPANGLTTCIPLFDRIKADATQSKADNAQNAPDNPPASPSRKPARKR